MAMPTRQLQRDLHKQNPFDSLPQEVTVSILRTNDLLQHRFARLFRDHGLTQAQFNILRILRGAGEKLPALEIARRMITVVPGITRLIDTLEKQDMVCRERCTEDRRVVYITITAAGRRALKKLDQPNLDLHQQLVGHLNTAEIKQLLKLLDKARTGIGAAETD